MAVLWSLLHNQRFLVVILLLLLSLNGCHSIEERLITCGNEIDLANTNEKIHSGILKVQMPSSFKEYQGSTTRKRDCQILIYFGTGTHLQIELFYLDIMPISSNVKACSTGLEVEDSTGRQIYGGRLCMEGWRWEKQHREKKQEKKVVRSSPLTFRLVSEGPYEGTGFRVHFNLFRPAWPCYDAREFKCERLQRCISDDITCDGWDDCGDDSDESEDAGCDLLTVSEIFAVIIGVFLLIGTVALSVVFMIKYRRIMKRNRLLRFESKLALEEERRSMQEPVLSFPHRFNSMESMNKSQYSRTTGQRLDSDSIMGRNEIEKGDRYSYKDNMSERSYKSNSHRNRSHENGSDRYGPTSRKNRAASQSSLTKEKAGIVGSSIPESHPELEKEMSDRNDKGPERRRSKERRRYSDDDDDDYDSDRERRRRRRSRERRRYDRSDDEDYDSDLERDRRRRSRDRRRYDRSDDEDYDSDPDKRRRSRDRRRYDRSSDEDYDSESGRRRSRERQKRYKNSDEENDSDKERRRRSRDRRRYRGSDEEYDSDRDRRRRSRDRRRYDSDEYDSDRDRRRRRSRDRRSRDMSEIKDEKETSERPQESSVKPPSLSSPHTQQEGSRDKQQPGDDSNPRKQKEIPKKVEDVPVQQKPDNYPPPSTPPKSEHLPRSYNRPRVADSQPANESNGNAWVPRSERKRNRRSRGDPMEKDSSPPKYEDVVPRVVLENLGYHEEAV